MRTIGSSASRADSTTARAPGSTGALRGPQAVVGGAHCQPQRQRPQLVQAQHAARVIAHLRSQTARPCLSAPARDLLQLMTC